MYSAISTGEPTGSVASASLGSTIENGGRQWGCQVRHPASKCNTAPERLRLRRTGWYESCDGLASIRNRDFVPFSDLGNQCGQVLPGFTYSSFFHTVIVLHVALMCNYRMLQQRSVARTRRMTSPPHPV